MIIVTPRLNRCWQDRTRITGPAVLVAACLASALLGAQSDPTRTMVERMHAYFHPYSGRHRGDGTASYRN